MTASYESISRFTGKRVFEKAVNSLIGIIEGISICNSNWAYACLLWAQSGSGGKVK